METPVVNGLWPPPTQMVTRLSELTDDSGTIMDLLGWDTFLSGGLVLQTMLGERWDTDIDIYTTNDDLSRFESLGLFVEAEPDKDEFGYSSLAGVKRVMTSTSGLCKIDVIVVTGMIDVFNGFDFDFCKCCFDGEEFVTEHADAILTKSCATARVEWGLRNYPHRRRKYEDRGFTIIDLNDLSPSAIHAALTDGVDWGSEESE